MKNNKMLKMVGFACAVSMGLYGSSGNLMVDPLLDADLYLLQSAVVGSLNTFVQYINDNSASNQGNPQNIKSLNDSKTCYQGARSNRDEFRKKVNALFSAVRSKLLPIQNAENKTFSSRVAWNASSSASSLSIMTFADPDLKAKQDAIQKAFQPLVAFINSIPTMLPSTYSMLGDYNMSIFVNYADNFENMWIDFASAVFTKYRAAIDDQIASLLNNATGQQVSSDTDLTVKITSKGNQNVQGNNNSVRSDSSTYTDNSGQKQNSDNTSMKITNTDNSGQALIAGGSNNTLNTNVTKDSNNISKVTEASGQGAIAIGDSIVGNATFGAPVVQQQQPSNP